VYFNADVTILGQIFITNRMANFVPFFLEYPVYIYSKSDRKNKFRNMKDICYNTACNFHSHICKHITVPNKNCAKRYNRSQHKIKFHLDTTVIQLSLTFNGYCLLLAKFPEEFHMIICCTDPHISDCQSAQSSVSSSIHRDIKQWQILSNKCQPCTTTSNGHFSPICCTLLPITARW